MNCASRRRIPQALSMSKEEAEKVIQEYEAANPVIPDEPDRKYQVAKSNLAAWQLPPEPELVIKQTIISFGPLAFLPFPFEMFSMFSLRLRKYSNLEYPLLCSIGNGHVAYMPDPGSIAIGGYEICCRSWERTYVTKPEAGDLAVSQTLKSLREMKRQ